MDNQFKISVINNSFQIFQFLSQVVFSRSKLKLKPWGIQLKQKYYLILIMWITYAIRDFFSISKRGLLF